MDVEFANAFVPLVDLAVGFSVGMEGNGDEFGLPAADELLGGGGGGDGGGEEDEEGGDVAAGGEFAVGAGEDLGLAGGGGGWELDGDFACGGGGDFDDGAEGGLVAGETA